MRGVRLFQALGDCVSELGEIGIAFRVEDFLLDEFPKPLDQVQIR
jgi:hypothetical protein